VSETNSCTHEYIASENFNYFLLANLVHVDVEQLCHFSDHFDHVIFMLKFLPHTVQVSMHDKHLLCLHLQQQGLNCIECASFSFDCSDDDDDDDSNHNFNSF
jgi:hypothetical protein